MAGRPKKRAATEILWGWTRREYADPVTGECDATPLDYAVEYLASGKGSLTDLAEQVSVEMPRDLGSVSREVVRTILHGFPDARERLEAARKETAHALVEEDAAELRDEYGLIQTDVDVRKAKMRSDLRRFRAASYDRDTFGVKGGIEVNINLGALHLAALRAREVALPNVTVKADEVLLGPGDVTVED